MRCQPDRNRVKNIGYCAVARSFAACYMMDVLLIFLVIVMHLFIAKLCFYLYLLHPSCNCVVAGSVQHCVPR